MDYNHLLTGKRVFVTSGQRGIGKEIAVLFARQGAQVAVGGPRREVLDATAAELSALSSGSRGYLCDLSDPAQTEETLACVLQDFGGVDILVNTVGVNRQMPVHEITDDDLLRLMEINYYSGIRCARRVLPGMMERNSGCIINISSIHGVVTMPKFALYAGTKGAMNASARAMALDYAKYGIRVNTICPGLILSDNMVDEIDGYPPGAERTAFLELLHGMQPLPPGGMADVANAALFLASDMSSYMTGQTLMVDGGASAKAH